MNPAALTQRELDLVRGIFLAAELDELPLPYRFEVQAVDHIHHRPLVEHIKRVGIVIYPESEAANPFHQLTLIGVP